MILNNCVDSRSFIVPNIPKIKQRGVEGQWVYCESSL